MQPTEVKKHSTTDSLCQPEERREGIYSQPPCGDRRRGAIMKDPAPPGTGLKRERREAKHWEEINNLGGGRLDQFAGQHALAQ